MTQPALFFALLLLACVTSLWKVNLPIALASGSTLSVSYAANLMSLLLLGTGPATVIAAAGVLVQCTINIKRPYPTHRTIFSVVVGAVTMLATGYVYHWLGGTHGHFDIAALPRPLVGAILTYFVVNTGLIALAIALSTGRSPFEVWRTEFLWSGASFFVAGGAGAASELELPAREHDVLVELMTPPGRVVSKKTLAEKLSGFDDHLGANALEAFISRLRKKLVGSGSTIRTLRGLGYLIEADRSSHG